MPRRPMDQLAALADFTLAMLLGGVIGFDRELENKPAGLRTHIMIAGAAALVISLGPALLAQTGANIEADPTRIVHAVITGVSVLGAGTIFRSNDRSTPIEGLTTAATTLVTAAVGITAALKQYTLAIGAVALAVIVLRMFKWIERQVRRHHHS